MITLADLADLPARLEEDLLMIDEARARWSCEDGRQLVRDAQGAARGESPGIPV